MGFEAIAVAQGVGNGIWPKKMATSVIVNTIWRPKVSFSSIVEFIGSEGTAQLYCAVSLLTDSDRWPSTIEREEKLCTIPIQADTIRRVNGGFTQETRVESDERKVIMRSEKSARVSSCF